MLTMSRFISLKNLLAVLAVFALAGCTAAVDKSEVEQKSNPVADLHQELGQKLEAEKNALEWYSYENALIKARKEDKVVMIDFYATWCHWCKELDKTTYADPKVVEALKAGFVPVKVDAESEKTVIYEMRQISMTELADKYGVKQYPNIWFIDKDGNKAKLLEGYLPPKEFLSYLKYIKDGSYKTMEFEEYLKKVEGWQ